MQNETIGIYLITERATGRMYVGLSGARGGIEGRWVGHKKRFPQELFTYEILHPCPPGTTREELSNLEKFYIRELDCMEPKGFNRTSGGTRSTEFSQATRDKISAAGKGRDFSEDHKQNISKSLKGNSNSKGRFCVHSEETKKKISDSCKRRAPPSEETRAKISAANKGRPLSEERRAKISAANKGQVPHNKGKPHSEETRAKLRGRVPPNKGIPAYNKGKPGKPLTEEQKAKQSAALKAQWILRRAAKAAAVAALEALLIPETETILSPE